MPNQYTAPTTIDPRIKEWATETQKTYIDAINACGGMRAACRKLGVGIATVSKSIATARQRAAAHNYAPEHDAMTRGLPAPLVSRGNSVLRDGDGKILLTWEKSKLDDQRWLEAIMQAVDALSEELPRLEPTPVKPRVAQASVASLLTVYTLTDSHVGMLAWGKETGADWDLRIAERVLTDCFEEMIRAAPNSKVGFLNQLGDFLHQDGLQAVTPTSHHHLDSDGRFEKIIEVAVRILRRVIGLMLAKHEKVVVGLFEGNHDIVSSIWLRKLFEALYENEPRVEIIDSKLPYSVYQHGKDAPGLPPRPHEEERRAAAPDRRPVPARVGRHDEALRARRPPPPHRHQGAQRHHGAPAPDAGGPRRLRGSRRLDRRPPGDGHHLPRRVRPGARGQRCAGNARYLTLHNAKVLM